MIGDTQKFVEHVKDKYARAIALTKDTQKKRTQQNIKMIEEYMRKVRFNKRVITSVLTETSGAQSG